MSMQLEPDLKMALSFYQNKGAYALLLGTGVSRSAGIKTSWEIVLELIREIVHLREEDPEPSPEKWFHDTFHEEPNYSVLLSELPTETERMNYLRRYFEPTDEEREEGKKVPTPAHKAIARLVKNDYVRVILTTNFDKLMEQALEEAGITPTVVISEYNLNSALPIVHSGCTVVKLHGDYLDPKTMRNTLSELSEYPDSLKEYLKRVFDEFGLIVCGWSGKWDGALRKAIIDSPSRRRFSTWWLSRGEVKEEAKLLLSHCKAEVVFIKSADEFFTNLEKKVMSLHELKRSHPISIDVAVATVKRYLSDPRFRIPLEDFFFEETERVYKALFSEQFETQKIRPTEKEFQRRVKQYEAITEKLTNMLISLAFYDREENSELLLKVIERLGNVPQTDGYDVWRALQYYPALIVIYAVGIVSLAKKRFKSLASVLLYPKYRERIEGKKRLLIRKTHLERIFDDHVQWWLPFKHPNAVNRSRETYMFDVLRPLLQRHLPDDIQFTELFDIFEYLFTLNFIDLVTLNEDDHITGFPVGWYWFRYRAGDYGLENTPISDFFETGLREGAEWGLLKAGFFDGSPERLQEVDGVLKTKKEGVMFR